MNQKNTAIKAKNIVLKIQKNLDILLIYYYRNKYMNFQDLELSNKYKDQLNKVISLYTSLMKYVNIPNFCLEDEIKNLKSYKETKKIEIEKIVIHANSFHGEKFITCRRCGGRGFFLSYSHIRSGKCHDCNGKCVVISEDFKNHMKLIYNNNNYININYCNYF